MSQADKDKIFEVPLQKLMRITNSLIGQTATSTANKGNASELLDVCPESYSGSKLGYPFYHIGWVTANCTNVRPFNEVVTILLNMNDHSERNEKHAAAVFQGITESYPNLEVIVATKKGSGIADVAKDYSNIKVSEVDEQTTSGKVWNDLVASAATPYVLIGRDFSHFSWLALLERQVRVISVVPNVKVAGGSFRNTTGHWQVGCYQRKLLNYVLEYTDGYFYSRNECMYCDHLVGSFVTKTDLLKDIKFDESLPYELFVEDWFLRVRQENHEVMSCPDAMYFTAEDYDYGLQAKISNKETWLLLAKKWTLNRIVLPGHVIHKYSCRDIGYKCDTGITSSMALPICCSEQQVAALSFFHDICVKNNLFYELDGGTVLNAAKLRTMLPWELDGDLILARENVSFFLSDEVKSAFANAGFPLSGFKVPVKNEKGEWKSSGYMYLNTPDMYFEVWGYPRMSNIEFLPANIRHIRTLVLYGGKWVIGPYNPGLFSRNRYGHEVYKHAQHWIVLGVKDSWSNYDPGSFKKCKDPKFHGCLDKLPADGNIPWFVPDN